MKKFARPVFWMMILISISGCATVFGGYKNKLVVENGSPPHAGIYLDGQMMGTAPINQKVDKYLLQHGSLIELRSEGYITDTIIVERHIHPYYTLADVLTGGIWMLVDVSTGNLYRPAIGKINYSLEKADSNNTPENEED